MSGNRQDRRYPQNLQGVLQLAVEAGSAAEGPAPLQPMSEEVRACAFICYKQAMRLYLQFNEVVMNTMSCGFDLSDFILN